METMVFNEGDAQTKNNRKKLADLTLENTKTKEEMQSSSQKKRNDFWKKV